MQCPVDGETLVLADRGGVEIDYCPKCRGVWLDRGELDKIIERSGSFAPTPLAADMRNAAPAPVYQPEPRSPARPESRRPRDDDDEDDDRRYGKRKRRDSFLSEIFDF